MAQPSLAPRAPLAENASAVEPIHGAPSPLGRIVARVKAILTDRSDSRLAQLGAGLVFLVRVANAMLMLVTQVLFARWMGSFEFGVYIYAWTWVLMIGSLSDMGLSSAARRFIPEYTELKAFDRLRGFLAGSRWIAFGTATSIALAGALGVLLARPYLDSFAIIPLYLGCVIIPMYSLAQVQAGIAQS
jgi:O-antigen/teichoic acid export membrane protein